MKKIFRFFIASIDWFIYGVIILLSLLVVIFTVCLKRKSPRKPSNKRDPSILFLSSGSPIKRNNIQDQQYQSEWNQYFQKQFLCFGNEKAYIFYSGLFVKEVYKLTNNVVAFTLPLKKSVFYFRKTISILNLFKEYFFLLSFIKSKGICTLCTYVPSDRLLLAALIKKINGLYLTAFVMGNSDLTWSEFPYDMNRLKLILVRAYEKAILFFFFSEADKVIAYNNHLGDYALSNGANLKKIRRTRIYPCITEFDAKAALKKTELKDFPQTKKVILMWSRLSYEKKIPFALEGAIKALKENKDYGLCVIGYGPLEEDIKKKIDNSGVKNRISLLGFVSSNVLLSYIYNADVALIPLGGFSLLEATLLKKPIVCFDIEWHHELLTDGYSAYFADYPNSEMIAEKLHEALENPEEARKRGVRANERYKILFNEDRIMQREKKIINERDFC